MSNKVLIAHGNTPRLKRAVAELQSAGLEVVATPDGGDAFARFFEEMPDLVVCSEVLPGLSGLNFARMVRSQSPDTPVVILAENDPAVLGDEFVVLNDPLELGALKAALPALVPDVSATPAPALGATGEALPVSAPTDVFILAALKRFQRGSNILALLDEHGIVRMARIAQHQSRNDSDQIIKQGDTGDGFYLVVEGQVRVTLAEKENAEVARITEGGFFGEMAMLSDQPRSASVWSVGSTTLLYFGRPDFLPFLDQYPTLREVLGGVALKRTEENLWRVLFADDEVQRSIAELQEGRGVAPEGGPLLLSGPPPAAPRREVVQAPELEAELPPMPRNEAPPTEEMAAIMPQAHDGRPAWLTRLRALTIPRPTFVSGAFIGCVVGVLLGGWSMSVLGPLLVPPGDEAPAEVAGIPTKPSEPEVAAPPPSEAKPHDVAADTTPKPQVDEAAAPANPPSEPEKAPAEPENAVTEPEKLAQAPKPSTEPPKPDAAADKKELRKTLLGSYKAGEWKAALEAGRKMRDTFGLDWEAEYALADAERNAGHNDEAVAAFNAFVAKYPTNTKADDAQFYVAEILWARGKKDDAKKLYQAIVDNPKSDFKTSARERLGLKP